MSKRTLVFGVITNALVALCCYLTNLFVQHTNDAQTRLYGGLLLSLLSLILIILFITRWATLNTPSFFVVNMMMFLRCSFDLLVVVEKCLEPNAVLLTEYLRIDDPLVRNVYSILMSAIGGTLLHLLNYIIFYRVNLGLHTRNLLLFNSTSLFTMSTVYLIITLTSGLSYHPFTIIVMIASSIFIILPFLVMKSKRDFELKKPESQSFLSHLLSFLAVTLMVMTAVIFVCKLLVTQGETAWPLNIISKNDPMLKFNDILDTYPYSFALCWMNAGLVVPTLAVGSLFHACCNVKPSFLWEMSLVRASMIITGQVFFIAGPLFWETSAESRVNPANPIFWSLNLIPVLAGIFEVLSLYQYKAPLSPPPKGNMNRRHSYGKL